MLCIAGHWREGGGEPLTRDDPSTGQPLWQGRAADAADVDAAFNAARRAFAASDDDALDARIDIARRYAALLETERDALARTIAREVGKPLWEARAEVGTMIAKVELSIRAQAARAGQAHSEATFGRHELRHRPHGVVAVFGPYNFPGHLPNGHIVPALLAGNAVLFKPSELTPMTGEAMVRLWHAAGLAPGLLNLVPGARRTGEAIVRHAGLDGLFFTGSSRTGALLNRQLAERPGVICALEMGGNNPLVVGRGVDIAAAVREIVDSAWISSGQRCTCARRLFVPDDADGDALLGTLVAAGERLTIGPAEQEPSPFLGPVVSAAVAEHLLAVQQGLLDDGAHALLPMRRLDALGPAFVSPALLDVTAIVEHLPDEEHFGPLLSVVRYDEFERALQLAGRTRYGLSAGFLGDDDGQWQRFRKVIRAGIVNRNRPTTGASGAFPFGGAGASGNHRPSAWYAADYCAYPVASAIADRLATPAPSP